MIIVFFSPLIIMLDYSRRLQYIYTYMKTNLEYINHRAIKGNNTDDFVDFVNDIFYDYAREDTKDNKYKMYLENGFLLPMYITYGYYYQDKSLSPSCYNKQMFDYIVEHGKYKYLKNLYINWFYLTSDEAEQHGLLQYFINNRSIKKFITNDSLTKIQYANTFNQNMYIYSIDSDIREYKRDKEQNKQKKEYHISNINLATYCILIHKIILLNHIENLIEEDILYKLKEFIFNVIPKVDTVLKQIKDIYGITVLNG